MPPVSPSRILSLTENVPDGEYKTVAASQTAQVLGVSGAIGDVLHGVLIVPGTTAAGAVSIKDGGNSAITIFPGGGSVALGDLKPFYVSLGGILSAAGAWQITTGTNVTCVAVGKFT